MPVWRGIALLLGVFAALCTAFGLVVTLVQARQDHAQAEWPQAMARVVECRIDQSSTRNRNRFYIDCVLSYEASGENVTARVYSRQQFGAPTIPHAGTTKVTSGVLKDWLDAHPPGSAVSILYDPDNHTKVIAELPLTGPHTPDNLKLLGVTAGICMVLLGVGTVGRGVLRWMYGHPKRIPRRIREGLATNRSRPS